MNVNKQDLEKSQVELNVELSPEEFQPFIDKAVQEISQETTIEGFRPGKASYEVVKQKVGEMSILDKAARIAVNETLDKAIQENVEGQPIGQPQVDVTKLSSGNPMAYKAVISLLPEVKLGDYKNVPVEAEQVEPNEEEVDKTVKTLQEQYAEEKEVDRGAQKGDKVTVDINMSQDNVPVEGGQSQDTDVTLGQNYLVPGFDDNLIGSKKEDDLNFQIQYPENHHQKNLAGQNVDFNVKVKGVKERNIPEVDDEFAKKFGINSLDELKNILRDNISQEQKQKADQRTEIKMIDQILEKSEFGDIPTSLIDQEANKMLSEIQQNVTSQGGKFEDYLQSIGKSQEQLLE
ncbi:MAG TPA: trigger factor, partial [Patescibacteria group bacterium]|nr:trigger factor [Patescibacteria group bacterium]